MILAVIPARGGSKRIPGKNTKAFCGKPILQYSIDAALEAGVFDEVIVSTDCEAIAETARRLGATTPFLRPAELSDDFTPTIPVIRHAIQQVQTKRGRVRYACCIYATAPFVRADDLRAGLRLLKEDAQRQFAFPVTTFPFPIQRALKLSNGRVSMIHPELETTRSQDLPEAWHDAGQFYWGTGDAWERATGIYSAHSAGIPIPRTRVQDIDTPEDWQRAEQMFQSELTIRSNYKLEQR
ncbi:pseudaminic acid cytidylyltransferase [Roseimaritima sediminicola]|uniref:pseudaminic acid cytidylyltransferase n=1 Tax=Roseimaritima sediminicola TaxID=2662066 RepID=UPI0012984A2C|nr:pseudaminic acid cytidylyltransferase [Roseimaritima sediminicola]